MLSPGSRAPNAARPLAAELTARPRRDGLRRQFLTDPTKRQHDRLFSLAAPLIDVGGQLFDELRKSNSLAA